MTSDTGGGKRFYTGLAASALVLGGFAAVVGSPAAAGSSGTGGSTVAGSVNATGNTVAAVELARWIKDRRQGLRIVDTRDSAEFEDYHIPGAERIALGDLTKKPFGKDETIVLYSDGGSRASQAWAALHAQGYSHVYFIRGGLYEWLDNVMNPTISPTANDSARSEFKKVAELSRYFGGVPRVTDSSSSSRPGSNGQKSANAVSRVRGRGC